jgi:hypothetical protein
MQILITDYSSLIIPAVLLRGMKTWAQQLYQFYSTLQPAQHLPNAVQWLYPQQSEEVMQVVEVFLQKYYNDTRQRRLFLGINPGRYGAGVTGVNFTAPRQLTVECGIDHPFKMQSELSAEFIYAMINAYGGPESFYQDFFIGSVCPLGFVKGGKNINYYDDKELLQAVRPFIVKSIETQLQLPVDRSACFCIGGEKNYKFLAALNEQYQWFREILPLPHPRFIMQYRRKQIEAFIQLYLDAIKK